MEDKKHAQPTANVGLPRDFDANIQAEFKAIKNSEIDFAQFRKINVAQFAQKSALAANPALAYKPSIGKKTPCGNGNFETMLDPYEWEGASGIFPAPVASSTTPPGGTINFSGLMAGLASGAIGIGTTHQTHVTAGFDPTLLASTPSVSMATTAQSSTGAVRIGNTVNGRGCELLSKTFTVLPGKSTATFWYAVVFQDPGHSLSEQPFFWVRVTDASGAIVPGAFDFGLGSDGLVAQDPSINPFFQKVIGPPKPGPFPIKEPIVYKDWSCAQVDLSSMLGKQVTIEFITGDCGQGGHWGYAYVDNFCGNCNGSPTGSISYNCETSSHCGPGNLCFDYELPRFVNPAGVAQTGEVVITLDIYQNATKLTTMVSPQLTSGTSYCFAIDPATIPGLDPSFGGFDAVATGTFTFGQINLGQNSAGSVPEGIKPGRNNDYQIKCKSCAEHQGEQNAVLAEHNASLINTMPSKNCNCPDSKPGLGDCDCKCETIKLPVIEPCISIKWGDSACDCLETDDMEVLSISVCNCYSNVTFSDLSIAQISVTELDGSPVPVLPDGTPSVRVIPTGPICFGDIGPCTDKDKPNCVSREVVLYTRGAVGRDYLVSFNGVCFSVSHHLQSEKCFVLKLCQD
jgi:hypothetical protein